MNAFKIITTTLGATVIGIALGILFAPNKGSRTRREISRKGHEYADYITDGFDDMIDNVSHSIESVENESSRLVQKGKAQVKKAAAELNSKMH
jgi:gas vesicle protein